MDTISHQTTEEPAAARVVTMALSMITISVLAVCLSEMHRTQLQLDVLIAPARRIQFIKTWKKVPLPIACEKSLYC